MYKQKSLITWKIEPADECIRPLLSLFLETMKQILEIEVRRSPGLRSLMLLHFVIHAVLLISNSMQARGLFLLQSNGCDFTFSGMTPRLKTCYREGMSTAGAFPSISRRANEAQHWTQQWKICSLLPHGYWKTSSRNSRNVQCAGK